MQPQVTLINPPIVEKITIATTIPLGISYLAGYARGNGLDVQLIDALGEKIFQRNFWKDNIYYIGMGINEIVEKINPNTNFICLSANFSLQKRMYLDIIKKIREKFPKIVIIAGGNDSTLNFSFYLENGVDFAILGEGENTLTELISKVAEGKDYTKIDGLAYIDKEGSIKNNPKTNFIEDIDTIPYPARDLLPLENYWKKKFSHGPVKERYTPIVSSRGCPLNCAYCSSTIFWQRKWRARSPKNFVDEIEECFNKYGISEFEIEDDAFSFNIQRAIDICNEIIKRGLGSKITWNTPNGIRPENMNKEVLTLFKNAGCKYLVFAPESGSQRLLKEVYNKFISLDLIADLVRYCYELKIRVAAFIIVGLPVQTNEDYRLTKGYIQRLARLGLDEVIVFPLWPYPNTPITQKYFKDYDATLEEQDAGPGGVPLWYPNRDEVIKRIKEMYAAFYKTKLIYHPLKCLDMAKNVLIFKQETKVERTILALISKYVNYLLRLSKSNITKGPSGALFIKCR